MVRLEEMGLTMRMTLRSGASGGNVQGIQVGIRIECQRHSLIEALGTHSALELIAAVLVSRQAPGGDLGSFQEGGG